MKIHERRRRLAGDVAVFVHQYARKRGPKGLEPNDRNYSRKVEELVKRMEPEELDYFLHDEFEIERTDD